MPRNKGERGLGMNEKVIGTKLMSDGRGKMPVFAVIISSVGFILVACYFLAEFFAAESAQAFFEHLVSPYSILHQTICVLFIPAMTLVGLLYQKQKDLTANLTQMVKLKTAELETINEKLRVIGGLTRHDVRNKLSAITGNAYLAKKELAGNGKALGYLGEMETAVNQVVEIFDFAKTYEMLGVEKLVYVDVEKTVDEAISLLPELNHIKIINDCRGLAVLADSLLRQLFYNLIDNSLKHGEKLSWIRVHYEEKKGGHLDVIYEDNGAGIPPAAKPKLFNEGHTTGKGSGYGLYLIKKMMEVYDWAIEETGEQGKGAKFVVTMPETNSNGKESYIVGR